MSIRKLFDFSPPPDAGTTLPLRENPLLWHQFRRLRRMPLAIALLLLYWVLSMLLFRGWIPNMILELVFQGYNPVAVYFVLHLVAFTLRPEIIFTFILFLLLNPPKEWERLRPQLALSFFKAKELAIAYVAGAFTLLTVLNLVSGPFFYGYLYSQTSPAAGDTLLTTIEMRFHSLSIIALAMMEDIFYVAIVCSVLLKMNHEPRLEKAAQLFGAIFRILLIGILITVLSNLYSYVDWILVMFTWPNHRVEFLSAIIPQLGLLITEALLIRHYWRDGVNKVQAWLESESES